jgi:hypothetical protein
MNDLVKGTNNEEAANGILGILSGAVGDLVTGIPAPIRKNAIRVFTRLCTAAVEHPVALIEGAIAERRAESLARVKLIDSSADQIAEQMRTSPEYARAAAIVGGGYGSADIQGFFSTTFDLTTSSICLF